MSAKSDRKNELKEQIKRSWVNKWQRFCDFREIQNLLKVINDGENIIQAVNGYMPYESNGTGLIILTNQRVIFFDHSLFFKNQYSSIPLYKLNSVSPNRSIFYGYIDFDDGNHTFTAKHILAWKCSEFAKIIEEQMQKMHQQNDKDDSNTTSRTNPIQQLQELNQAHQNGNINDHDYLALKKKILS